VVGREMARATAATATTSSTNVATARGTLL
jgi:hypothetical protein